MIRTALFLIAELLLNLLVISLEPRQQPGKPEQTATPQQTASPALQEVVSFERFQPTGVAVSKTGRVFVSFPLWSDDYQYAVVEVMSDGSTRPFPDEQWNAWKTKPQRDDHETATFAAKTVTPAQTFVCVQSVSVDDKDRLWVLDAASPKMESVVPGGPKLVCVNLQNNRVDKVIPFSDEIAPPKSYLNDLRVDTKREYAYITDSGMGAIVVVNLNDSKSKRVLADHPSTKAEKDITIVVQGVQLRDDKTGDTPQIHSDGIALTDDGDYLYCHALTGKTMYRVPTASLRDASLAESSISDQVEKVADPVVCDGMLMDDQGRVYLAAIEQDAIMRFDPTSKQMETVVKDRKISWPDSMAWGSDGNLYFTTSQIQNMPRFNKGQTNRTEPYRVFKIAIK